MHRCSYLFLMLIINATSYSMEQRAWYAPASHDKEAEEARELDQWFDPEGLKEVCEPEVVPEVVKEAPKKSGARCLYMYCEEYCDGPDEWCHHMRMHLEQEEQGQCQDCGKLFAQRNGLKRHLVRMHQVEKAFNCFICGQVIPGWFFLQDHIRRHIADVTIPKKMDQEQEALVADAQKSRRYVPVDMKRFACSYCPSRFCVWSQKVNHERIHTGEKPFACQECGRAFAQKCNLMRHIRIHTKAKPYVCWRCGKSFTRQAGFEKHMRGHEREL